MASLNTTQTVNGSAQIKDSDKGFLFLITLATVLSVLCAPYTHRSLGRIWFCRMRLLPLIRSRHWGTFWQCRPWYVLWGLQRGSLLTMTYSWINYGGDVSYGRLASKGFETSPHNVCSHAGAYSDCSRCTHSIEDAVSTTLLLLTSLPVRCLR